MHLMLDANLNAQPESISRHDLNMELYHLKDGLYFKRTPNGVKIIKTSDGALPHGSNTVWEVDASDCEWESVGDAMALAKMPVGEIINCKLPLEQLGAALVVLHCIEHDIPLSGERFQDSKMINAISELGRKGIVSIRLESNVPYIELDIDKLIAS
jgi:hypothetical protein